MKKAITLFSLLSVLLTNAVAQDVPSLNKNFKSGIWLKMGYDLTFSNFLYDKANKLGVKSDYGINFQFGTTFFIGAPVANKFRLGLDAGWIDFSYFKLNDKYVQHGGDAFLNFLEIGPKIRFSPTMSIAIDLYGRVVPSVSLMYYDGLFQNSSTTYTYFGFNASGLIGATFCVKDFTVGLEYNFGKMTYKGSFGATPEYKYNLITNNIRILIGIKF